MADLLLPCPFCGSQASWQDDPLPSGLRYGIGCSNMRCTLWKGYGVKLFETEAEAVSAWNTRSPMPTYDTGCLCDMCARGCNEGRVIHVGQGAYSACERFLEDESDRI